MSNTCKVCEGTGEILKKFTYENGWVICPHCKGAGIEPEYEGGRVICKHCKGAGIEPEYDDPWRDHLEELGHDPLGRQNNNPLK